MKFIVIPRRVRSNALPRVAAAAFALFATALSVIAAEGQGRVRPNVIFVLADDLGFGDVGYSQPPNGRIKTPNIDRLAREGVVLTDHYAAAPVCAPSRASLLTGRAQGRCSLRDNCFDRAFSEKDTLGTVMKAAGYATWAVGKWGIAGGGESGEPVTSHPLDRGFDYFYGFLDHMAGHTYYHYSGHVRRAFMGITENRTDATASASGIYSTDLFAAKTKQLISSHVAKKTGRPFFLYLAVNTVHGSGICDDTLACKDSLHVPGRPYPEGGVEWPLQPEPREARNTWIDPRCGLPASPAARYATAIARLDDALGDVANHLKKLGIDRDTMIVFTSDNGPADEYGADPRTFASTGPFDGMKRDVFEGGMRVPAFVRWPAGIAAGAKDGEPSQFHDWMATLADLSGTSVPELCDGVSLLPRWKTLGEVSSAERRPSLVYSQYEFPWDGSSAAFREFKARKGAVRGLQQMLRVGDYVALRTRIRDGAPKTRLYNVAVDPFETKDISGEPGQSERLAQMSRTLDERLR